MKCECGPCGCKGICAILTSFLGFGVAVFFMTDAIDKARYQTSVTISPNRMCKQKLVYDQWYYAIKDTGAVGKFEVAMRFHVENSTKYAHGNIVTGSMFMCQAHTGQIQPVSPTVCPNAWQYNEASCDLAYSLSACSEDLATTKTDLHLTTAIFDGSSNEIILDFKSNFGGGLYNLSLSTQPDVLKDCKLPNATVLEEPKAVVAVLEKSASVPSIVKASTCPPLTEKTWYYGIHDLGAVLGKFEVGLYMDGGKAYLCEAHTGAFQPVHATVCSNDFTHDDTACTLSITPSQCTQDLGNKQTDLHLQGSQRMSDASIGLNFSSHFGGGVYQLSTTTQPDQLTNCTIPAMALEEPEEIVMPAACPALTEKTWYYGMHDLGAVLGKFEVGLYLDGGKAYLCEAHTGAFQPVPATVCANDFTHDDTACTLSITPSQCTQDLGTKKTDLHLGGSQRMPDASIGLNFSSHFGGGVYQLSTTNPPDQLTGCKISTVAPVAESATCPPLSQKTWYYGMHDLGAVLGKFEVGLYFDGNQAYLCEAHTGAFQPVPATVCANDFTQDDTACTLSITPSQCTQDLATNKTDLHFASAQRQSNASIGLSFTSHFGGGMYQLSTTDKPDVLANCKLPSIELII